MSNLNVAEVGGSAGILTKRGLIVAASLAALVVLTQIPGIRYSYLPTEDFKVVLRVDRLTGSIHMCRFFQAPTLENGSSMKCLD